MSRRLIVSADDFGLGPGVDRAIRETVAAGVVTSVGVIASLADPASVRALAEARRDLSLGLHVNLTTGRPLRPAREVPSLVDASGEFLPLGALTRRALAARIAPREVAREVTAQLARLGEASVAVDHLDSHEHVHLLPGVLAAVARVARDGGVTRIRSHRPRLLAPGSWWRGALGYYRRHPRRLATHAAKHVFAVRLRLAGLALPDGMVACSLLAAPPPGGPLAEWRAIAAALPPGIWELVVHPADLAVPLTATERAWLGDLFERRGAERAALLDPAFAVTMRAHGVELVPFSALPAGPEPAPARRARYA